MPAGNMQCGSARLDNVLLYVFALHYTIVNATIIIIKHFSLNTISNLKQFFLTCLHFNIILYTNNVHVHVCHSITIISYYEILVYMVTTSNTPTLNNATIYVLKMKETPAPALQQVADL